MRSEIVMRKFTKRTLAIMLALTMILCIGSVALAATEETGTQPVDVETDVKPSFNWTVPSGTLEGNGGTGTVTVSNCILATGTKLQITVASAHDWKLVNGPNSYIEYGLKVKDAELGESRVVLEVYPGVLSTSVNISSIIKSTEGVTLAGTHSDTLTFTATIVSD